MIDGKGDGKHSIGDIININVMAGGEPEGRQSNQGDHFVNYINVRPMYHILETNNKKSLGLPLLIQAQSLGKGRTNGSGSHLEVVC